MGKLRRAAGLPITKFTACAALEELVEGNRRFVLVSTAAASACCWPARVAFPSASAAILFNPPPRPFPSLCLLPPAGGAAGLPQ